MILHAGKTVVGLQHRPGLNYERSKTKIEDVSVSRLECIVDDIQLSNDISSLR